MPSLKLEEEYSINKQRYNSMKKGFKTAWWMIMLPTAGVLLVLALYYFICILAMLVGGNAFFGQLILNYANDTHERSELAVDIPYLYFGYLAVIIFLIAMSYISDKKHPIYVTFLLYAAGMVYSFTGLVNESLGVLIGLYVIAYSGYGIFVSSYILSLHKEHKYLSLQKGYPYFAVEMYETHAMANTSGLHYVKSEYLKHKQKENKEKPEEMEEAKAQSWEMEELEVNADIPKGTRKIDNMM